jgi:hypothetical protein
MLSKSFELVSVGLFSTIFLGFILSPESNLFKGSESNLTEGLESNLMGSESNLFTGFHSSVISGLVSSLTFWIISKPFSAVLVYSLGDISAS